MVEDYNSKIHGLRLAVLLSLYGREVHKRDWEDKIPYHINGQWIFVSPIDRWLQTLSEGEIKCRVLSDGPDLVGFVFYRPVFHNVIVFVEDFFIHPKYRSKKYGMKLFNSFCNEGNEFQIDIYGTTNTDQVPEDMFQSGFDWEPVRGLPNLGKNLMVVHWDMEKQEGLSIVKEAAHE